MLRRLTLRGLGAGLVLLALMSLTGLVVLGEHAQRGWALHWVAPTTLIGSTSSFDYSAAHTPRGWDIAWTDVYGHLFLSRFASTGRRIGTDVPLRGRPNPATQSLTLGQVGATDVVAWRQDTASGSTLRVATVTGHSAPVYRTVVAGNAPLEHPSAFRDGMKVGIVFSWQRPDFNVYLFAVDSKGNASTARQLTHTTTYAFSPRAVMDAPGTFRLGYFDQCCSASAFNVRTSRFFLDGRPLGKVDTVAQVTSIAGQGQGASPNRWGIDVSNDGRLTWMAWSGDQGLSVASWRGATFTLHTTILVPGTVTQDMALDTQVGGRELAWLQPFNLGTYLGTVSFSAHGSPLTSPDRVAFESASDDVPLPVSVGGLPAILWQAQPAKTNITRIEASRFSPQTITAPSLQARLGLGLGNPLSSLAVLAVGSLVFAIVLTVANILLIMACVVVFAAFFRWVDGGWKWYAYLVTLSGALYILFVSLGAPSPPILFLSGITGRAATVTVIGAVVFLVIVMNSFLRRIDDVYRAGMMAFFALYFLAFMQALTVIQDQIGRS